MTKDIWINLPVKDLNKSKAFFTELGFSLTQHQPPDMVGMMASEKNVAVCLVLEPTFKGYTGHAITDASQSTEVLFSLSAETREEVDTLAKKATNAGGSVFSKPGGDDNMYGCAFADPDGHRWNVLYMKTWE